MALPRKGLRGVEKIAETAAWTNSMAESAGGAGQGDEVTFLSVSYGFVPVCGTMNFCTNEGFACFTATK